MISHFFFFFSELFSSDDFDFDYLFVLTERSMVFFLLCFSLLLFFCKNRHVIARRFLFFLGLIYFYRLTALVFSFKIFLEQFLSHQQFFLQQEDSLEIVLNRKQMAPSGRWLFELCFSSLLEASR